LLGTDTAIFQPDLDPATTTDPLLEDTDGEEDPNFNGRIDPGEYEVNIPAAPMMLQIK
jgi:hypothetical protein